MAILRAEKRDLLSPQDTRTTYDVIAEASSDLTLEASALWSVGSLAYCMQDDKIYIKTADSDSGWEEIG